VTTTAERAATDGPWVERLARAGLVTRGLMHVVVGWIALRVATGEPGRRADQQGALATVVQQPFGRVLVGGLALGFLCYAAWRFVDAVLDPEDVGPVKRLGCALRGALYVGLFFSAGKFVLRGEASAKRGSKQQDVTARLLGLPFGRGLVAIAGVVVIVLGLWNGWRAVNRGFEKDLKDYEMGETARRWTLRLGSFGHLARMVAYLVCGGFLVRAAATFDSQKGVGLDASLHELAGRSFGPPLLVVVAAGLISFGVFQLVLARYRRVLGS
jgi:hypothetical protein